MDVIERITLIIKAEELTREQLAAKTGVSYTRWQNVMNKKAKIRLEDIEALGNALPEYAYWLAFGKELPACGQISPMTKKEQND